MVRPVSETGIVALDDVIEGGLPIGAISELAGPECSGRTAIALSFIARLTQASKVCAWIDVCDALDPVSAAAVGVDLARLLWIRCGVSKQSQRQGPKFALAEKYLVPSPVKKGLHGGGFGTHPRNEVRGVPDAIDGLLGPEQITARCAEPQRRVHKPSKDKFSPTYQPPSQAPIAAARQTPWSRMEQALKSADLLLQGGGFSAIVLDMGGLTPEFVSRIPFANWFRYRAAAERSQSSILLLTQYSCAKSAAELLLRLHSPEVLSEEATVFTGIRPSVEVERHSLSQSQSEVVPMRKPVQSATASWRSLTTWAGQR